MYSYFFLVADIRYRDLNESIWPANNGKIVGLELSKFVVETHHVQLSDLLFYGTIARPESQSAPPEQDDHQECSTVATYPEDKAATKR